MADKTAMSVAQQPSKALFAAAFEQFDEGVFILNARNEIVHCNDKASQITHYQAEALCGKSILTLVDAQDDNPLEQRLWLPKMPHYGDKIFAQLRLPDNEVLPVELFPGPFHYQGQAYLTLVMSDARKRRDIHSFYHNRESDLRDMLDNVPDSILRVDSELRVLYVNATGQKCLPATQALQGVLLTELIADTSLIEQISWSLQSVLHTGSQLEGLFRGKSQGRDSIYQIRFIPEFGLNHSLKSVLIIAREITRQFFADQQLKETHEQLRMMTQQLQRREEDERKHIAREIHDELGQHLTSLRVGLSLTAEQHPALASQLEKLTAIVDGTIKVVRNLSTQLRPAVLNMGLKPALTWLRDEFNKYQGCHCLLEMPMQEIDLPDDQVTTAFRVVQESLTNVHRHANAQRAKVSVQQHDRELVIKIHDDGVGFHVEHVPSFSFGLLGMRERCIMQGWSFSLGSELGKGTRVMLKIPLRTG
ncbi:PAS domain-containing protein [Paramixta manurensis]|uniref:PAS domain-containing protein n=1 Tax=Paramixta manurensis TaxID=2740817 RepID=A0A6M8U6U8_9GAMM|nr:PAS domain-containing protein [Erwiniaceae bacterium PD-1]